MFSLPNWNLVTRGGKGKTIKSSEVKEGVLVRLISSSEGMARWISFFLFLGGIL